MEFLLNNIWKLVALAGVALNTILMFDIHKWVLLSAGVILLIAYFVIDRVIKEMETE